MKTALLILLTLSGARKEALKRWPDGNFSLKVDQSKPKYVYELYVIVNRNREFFDRPRCMAELVEFKGKNWQAVMDASKGVTHECSTPENGRRN